MQPPIDTQATRIVHVEGPQRYSAKDTAAALSKLLDQNIVAEQVPRAAVVSLGLILFLVESLVRLLRFPPDCVNSAAKMAMSGGVG